MTHFSRRHFLCSLAIAVFGIPPIPDSHAETFTIEHPRSELLPGQKLLPGKALRSPDGRFVLEMQKDSNLVLYGPGRVAVWDTSTNGRDRCIAFLQKDGNFVVIAHGNRSVWGSGTNGKRNCKLVLNNDGNLVLASDGKKVWATNTRLNNFRFNIMSGGRASSTSGTEVINNLKESISIHSESLSINVSPGKSGRIKVTSGNRDALVQIRATSGDKDIVLGQLAIGAGEGSTKPKIEVTRGRTVRFTDKNGSLKLY